MLIISILVLAVVNWVLAPYIATPYPMLNSAILLVIKLLLLPAVAGISYELLKLFSIPRAMLPEVYPSGHKFGYTHKSVLGRTR